MKRLHLFVTTCAALTLSCKTGDSKSDSKSQSAVERSPIEIDPELGEFLWDGEAGSSSFVTQAQGLLQQFAAIETCLKDFVVFRNSGASDDVQLLQLL